MIPPLDLSEYDPDKVLTQEQAAMIAAAIEYFEEARTDILVSGASKNYIKGAKTAYSRAKKTFASEEIKDDVYSFLKTYKQQIQEGYTVIQGEKVYWLRDRVQAERQFIFDTISKGITEGKTPASVAKDLKDYFQTSRSYADLLARTETAYVQANGRDDRYKKFGVKKVKWLLGPRPCPECASYGGKVFTWDSLPKTQPAHVGCTCDLSPQPDDAVVSEPIKAPVKEPKKPDKTQKTPVKKEPKREPTKEPKEPKEKPTEEPKKEEPKKPTYEIIKEHENKIKNRKTEKAYLFNSDGEVVFEKVGTKSSVKFTQKELEQLRGNILTHNHPNGTSFSDADVNLACDFELKEIRAVGSNITSTLKMKDGSNMSSKLWEDKIAVEYEKQLALAEARYRSMLVQNKVTVVKYTQLCYNQTWTKVAKNIPELEFKLKVGK